VLVPGQRVLDNMAIFGAHMNLLWPERATLAGTVKAVSRIREALDWIVVDITRAENEQRWERLQAIEPERTRIELFDIRLVDALLTPARRRGPGVSCL